MTTDFCFVQSSILVIWKNMTTQTVFRNYHSSEKNAPSTYPPRHDLNPEHETAQTPDNSPFAIVFTNDIRAGTVGNFVLIFVRGDFFSTFREKKIIERRIWPCACLWQETRSGRATTIDWMIRCPRA